MKISDDTAAKRSSVSKRLFSVIILGFILYAVLVTTLGLCIFLLKAGMTRFEIIEYYKGSEATMLLYPEIKDRFIAPKTLMGLVKIQLPHILAYGLLAFLILHLIRSLDNRFKVRMHVDRFTNVFYLLLLVELFSGILLRFGSPIFVYLRILSLVVFTGLFYYLLLLLFLTMRTNSRQTTGPTQEQKTKRV